MQAVSPRFLAISPRGRPEAVKAAWLGRMSALIDSVESWARELGWSTRRIEKAIEDPEIGDHKAPALLLQEETHRAILDPLARSASGVEGVVDLYLMPAWDDVARVYFQDGDWRVHHVARGTSNVPRFREATPLPPLTKETLRVVLDSMKDHAA